MATPEEDGECSKPPPDVQAKERGAFRCLLCGINVPNRPSLNDHLRGRRHTKLCEERGKRQQQQERSVYVTGFPKGTTEEQLKDVFQPISSVTNVVMDKDRGLYAIVEFENADGVSLALAKQDIKIEGQRLKLKPREKKEFKKKKGGPRILKPPDPEDLSKELIRCSSVEEQMKQVVTLCSPSHHESRLRELLLSLLKEAFNEFFPGCQLHPFGSSVNGFEISGCDLDLYLELGEPEDNSEELQGETKTAEDGDLEGEKAKSKSNESRDKAPVMEGLEKEESDEKEEAMESEEVEGENIKHKGSQEMAPGEGKEDVMESGEGKDENNKIKESQDMAPGEDKDDVMESGDESSDDENITPGLSLQGLSNEEVLSLVERVLRQCVPGVHGVQTVISARRPVIRFQHKTSGLRGDITLNNKLALRNSFYLRLCSDLDPRVPQLVYTVRYWARVNQLAGNPLGGGPLLNNYALTLLIFFFLQSRSPPVIPSLSQLREMAENETTHTIDGWDCTFPSDHTTVPASKNQQSLGSLLSEFFTYFSSLDLHSSILCPRDGTILTLPLDTPSPPWAEGFRSGHLNVQDPFELSHNVCSNVSKKTARSFSTKCGLAARTCRSPLYQQRSSSRPWGITLLLLPKPTEGSKEEASEVIIPLAGLSLEEVFIAVKRVLVEVLLCSCEEESSWKNGVECETKATQGNNDGHGERSVSEGESQLEELNIGDDELDDKGQGLHRDETGIQPSGRKREGSEEVQNDSKRRKLESSTDDSSFNESPISGKKKCKKVKKANDPFMRIYVWHQVWEGRRKLRRSMTRKDGGKIGLETAVSHALSSGVVDGKMGTPLMQITIKAQQSEGSAKLNLTADVDDYQSSSFFFHFLKAFLPSIVPEMLKANSSLV